MEIKKRIIADKLELELDLEHPERYAMPTNLWNMCLLNMSWMPPVKGKIHEEHDV